MIISAHLFVHYFFTNLYDKIFILKIKLFRKKEKIFEYTKEESVGHIELFYQSSTEMQNHAI